LILMRWESPQEASQGHVHCNCCKGRQLPVCTASAKTCIGNLVQRSRYRLQFLYLTELLAGR
jgi:hypothetical protein